MTSALLQNDLHLLKVKRPSGCVTFQQPTLLPNQSEEPIWALRRASIFSEALVGMTNGAGLGRILSCAFDESCERNLEVVTVIADTHFDFVGALPFLRSLSTSFLRF